MLYDAVDCPFDFRHDPTLVEAYSTGIQDGKRVDRRYEIVSSRYRYGWSGIRPGTGGMRRNVYQSTYNVVLALRETHDPMFKFRHSRQKRVLQYRVSRLATKGLMTDAYRRLLAADQIINNNNEITILL
jgi:hypothetical protein